jgi:hypothetical protein
MVEYKPRIADDFAYIADRLREIENERIFNRIDADYYCNHCDGHGWRLAAPRRAAGDVDPTGGGHAARLNKWVVCSSCMNPYDKRSPGR